MPYVRTTIASVDKITLEKEGRNIRITLLVDTGEDYVHIDILAENSSSVSDIELDIRGTLVPERKS